MSSCPPANLLLFLPLPVVCTSVTCPFSCLSSLFSSAGSRILEFILSTPTAVSASVLNITSTSTGAWCSLTTGVGGACAVEAGSAWEPVLLSRDATPADSHPAHPQMDEPATSPASWPIADSFSELIHSQKAQFLCIPF